MMNNDEHHRHHHQHPSHPHGHGKDTESFDDFLAGQFGMSADEAKKKIMDEARKIRVDEEKIPGFFTTDFGAWFFDPEEFLLISKKSEYIIPLERVTSSACILDWIYQIQGKDWADMLDVYTLLIAFRRILDPQENYCSFEEDKRAEGADLAKKYAEKVEEHREETEKLECFQTISNALLRMLVAADRALPLSLILETLDFAREDVLDALTKLEQIKGIIFDRETKYVKLSDEFITTIQQVSSNADESSDCPEHQYLSKNQKKEE